MSQLIYGRKEELLKWATEKIDTGMRFRPDAKAIGLERDGKIKAVVVYDCFSEVDCNMHIASDGTKQWMNRQLLRAAFAHPFIQWKLNRVTGLVPQKNTQALKFDLHLGFVYEGLCRNATKDGDNVVILGMLKGECRYLPKPKVIDHD